MNESSGGLMKTLAIETAYDICGAALFDGGELVSVEEHAAPREHNLRLAPSVATLLERAGWQMGILNASPLILDQDRTPGSE